MFDQDRHIFAEWRVLSVVPHLMERVARETSLHPGWIRIFLFLPLNSQKLLWRIATNVDAYNVRLGSGGRQIVPLIERVERRARPKTSLQPPPATPKDDVSIVSDKRHKKKVTSNLSCLDLLAHNMLNIDRMWEPGGAYRRNTHPRKNNLPR